MSYVGSFQPLKCEDVPPFNNFSVVGGWIDGKKTEAIKDGILMFSALNNQTLNR